MIIGKCPYDDCDEMLWILIADKLPCFEQHWCEKCGRVIWTYHSRIDPFSLTNDEFVHEYKIIENEKRIVKI